MFDRSERTFAATFAKFGDLSYYTPVQRIGCYMDFPARLKKKHILDLIAFMKSAKKPHRDEEDSLDIEGGRKDYSEHCLFVGLMPEEDQIPMITEADLEFEQQEAACRVYDHHRAKVESSFEFKRVWSDALVNQAQMSVVRYLKYVDSPGMIRNQEITKFNS